MSSPYQGAAQKVMEMAQTVAAGGDPRQTVLTAVGDYAESSAFRLDPRDFLDARLENVAAGTSLEARSVQSDDPHTGARLFAAQTARRSQPPDRV